MSGNFSGRPVRIRKKMRWGRVFALSILLAGFIYLAYWGWTAIDYLFFSKAELTKVTWPRGKTVNTALLDKRMNVLVLGVDNADYSGRKRMDSILLVSFDLEKKGVAVISIPRETRVNVVDKKEPDRISGVYTHGGAGMARQAVADLLSVPVSYHIVLDARGFMQLVDILGGVGLYVENNMKYSDPYQSLTIDIKKGYQRLNGEQSLKYIKFRSDELGDTGRALRQQKFLKAFAGELFSVTTIVKAPYFKGALAAGIVTDMDLPRALQATRSFKSYDADGILFEMLPGSFFTIDNAAYWVSDPQKIAAAMNKLGIIQVK